MTLTDEQRERIIDMLSMFARHAQSSEERHYWGDLMRAEVMRRSPERIKAMEIAKGLRPA